MRFVHLILASLRRSRFRTALIFLSVVFAFLLYGTLSAVQKAFTSEIELAGVDRLRMTHKVTVIIALPPSYIDRIRATEGVSAATYVSWFGGYYREPRYTFQTLAVEPESFLDIYPEYVLPAEQRERWLQTRTGAIAGRDLAERFGWEIGDRLPIQSIIFRNRSGGAWEFTLEGIYTGSRAGIDETQLFFHWDYLEEASAEGVDGARWFAIRVADPAESAVVAERLDAQFENSFAETRTSTERAFLQSFANQVGNTRAILLGVVSVMLFVILLVVGTTIAQAVRERTPELGLLKALGFSDTLIFCLVLVESMMVCVVGGALGLALALLVTRAGDPTGGLLSLFYLSSGDLGTGIALAAGLGLASGAVPAVGALRLRAVESLRRT